MSFPSLIEKLLIISKQHLTISVDKCGNIFN